MKAAFPLAALALCACATAPLAGSSVRTDGFASIGQSTSLGGLVVTPQRVIEDSRCPMNARCIWTGRLVLESRVEGAGWREIVNLTLGERHAIHGTALALVSAEPGKMAGSPPSLPASMFGFELR